ncbi:Uncharacterised protein [uncultured archaeon]|nr:Uncharacterised protein [uncultured archaeon]
MVPSGEDRKLLKISLLRCSLFTAPLSILLDVTAPLSIFTDVTAPLSIFTDVTAPSSSSTDVMDLVSILEEAYFLPVRSILVIFLLISKVTSARIRGLFGSFGCSFSTKVITGSSVIREYSSFPGLSSLSSVGTPA